MRARDTMCDALRLKIRVEVTIFTPPLKSYSIKSLIISFLKFLGARVCELTWLNYIVHRPGKHGMYSGRRSFLIGTGTRAVWFCKIGRRGIGRRRW
jgi:hypothetical protein